MHKCNVYGLLWFYRLVYKHNLSRGMRSTSVISQNRFAHSRQYCRQLSINDLVHDTISGHRLFLGPPLGVSECGSTDNNQGEDGPANGGTGVSSRLGHEGLDVFATRLIGTIVSSGLHTRFASSRVLVETHAHLGKFPLAVVVVSGTSLTGVGDQSRGVRKSPSIGDLLEGGRGRGSASVVLEESKSDGSTVFTACGSNVVEHFLLVLVLFIGILVDFELTALTVLFDVEGIILLHVLLLVFEPGLREGVDTDNVVSVSGLATVAGRIVTVVTRAETEDDGRVLGLSVLGVLVDLSSGTSDQLDGVGREELVLSFLFLFVLFELTCLAQQVASGRSAADGGGRHGGGGEKEEGVRKLHGQVERLD